MPVSMRQAQSRQTRTCRTAPSSAPRAALAALDRSGRSQQFSNGHNLNNTAGGEAADPEPMYTYIVRRLAFGALTIVGVSIVVFLVLRVLPGDPLVAIFGTEGFTKLSAAQRANYMAQLGLSDPLPVQYLHWVRDIVTGSFGHSFFRAESVAELIARRGPLTAEIAFLSVVLSWLVGIPVAIVSALKPNSLGDNLSRFLSILFLAVPGFWLGMLIVLASLFWFGYRAPLAGASLFTEPWRNLQIVIGPAVVLGLGQAAYIARMARSSLLEVIREDYVRTARAKGLDARLVIGLHALPNALLPVITLSGILLGFVLAGSIPVERAFATPGLGYAMFNAVGERDIFVMQNLVFLYAVVFVMLNIVVDVTIAWLDPRIRYR
jgi:peptide/nickel transport system permease protein